MADKPRQPTTVEKVTQSVNKALGEQGCNYCQKYKPVDRVRKTRTRFGKVKFICDTCEDARDFVASNKPKSI